jgi:hypothetical protein
MLEDKGVRKMGKLKGGTLPLALAAKKLVEYGIEETAIWGALTENPLFFLSQNSS